MANTIRGREHYTTEIVKGINKLLRCVERGEDSYYSLDGKTHYNKGRFELFHSFDSGNAHFSIEVIEVVVNTEEDISLIESQ